MKILYITGLFPTPAINIIGSFITKRLEILLKNNIQFDIICPYFVETGMEFIIRKLLNKNSKLYEKEIINGFTYNYVPVKTSFFKRHSKPAYVCEKMADAIINKFDISKYDLIHTQWVYPQGYAASIIKKKHDIPLVVTSQGSDIHTIPFKKPNFKKYIVETLNNSDKFIFVSNYLLKKAREIGYKNNNYEIITNGADTKKFVPLEKQETIKKLNLPLDMKIVGFVGNLIYVKRVDKLPEIYNYVKDRIKNVLFVFIGSGKYKKIIEKKCQKYGLKTLFTNKIKHTEIPLWMNSFDVLVLPSRKEGFPNVVIEAQACGCPVVGSNCGGIPEAIMKNSGKVVSESDTFESDFADAIIEMLNNSPDKINMIEQIKEYDWNNIVKKEIEVYNEIISSVNPANKRK